MQLRQDHSLKVELLSFDQPDPWTERFYFLEMSTLQATTLVRPESALLRSNLTVYASENVFHSEDDIPAFRTIADFNRFFLEHDELYIQNCELELETGLFISSHDDGEVSIQFQKDIPHRDLITRIFKRFELRGELLLFLIDHPGHYIAIDKSSMVIGNYPSFDDYLAASRNSAE